MSWIRYDDQFYGNPKVTAVIAEDPAALSLHVLANTWSNGQKRPGFVPAHQPVVLILDRERAAAWTALLVKHGLWHDVKAMCGNCMTEYGDLGGEPGYVFHDHAKYRAPARDRTTPGTPAALSEKRREAGRRGGAASAAGRPCFAGVSKAGQQAANEANGQANGQANEANGQANGQANAKFACPPAVGEDSAAVSPTREDAPSSGAGFAGVSKTRRQREQGVTPEPVPEPKELKDSLTRADIGSDKDPDFTAFWGAYPRAGIAGGRPGKGQARTAYRKAVITNGTDPKLITSAAEKIRDFHAAAGTAVKFIPHAATWLNGECYNEAPGDDGGPDDEDFWSD